MLKIFKSVLDQGIPVTQMATSAVNNGIDWVFSRNSLIKSGQTPYELVLDNEPMCVKHYHLAGENEIPLVNGETKVVAKEKHAVPLILVPPLGVTTDTFDLMPERSLVRYMAAAGYKVYMVDWGKPRRRHGNLNLKDYAYHMMSEVLEAVRVHSGSQDVSMMGWCMGGLLCLLYQGHAQDPKVRNIVTIASPIDFRGGGQVVNAARLMNAPVKLLQKYTPFQLRQLNPTLLNVPSWMLALTFKATAPVSSVTTYWDLLTKLWDRKFVENHSTTADYLNNMLMYPGGVVQDFTHSMVMHNQMMAGKLEFRDGSLAELDRIESNLLAFAGKNDNIVPPRVAERSLEIVASEDKTYHLVGGGHMGVMVGRDAQQEVWQYSVDWLAPRSEVTEPGKDKPQRPTPEAVA